MFELLVRLNANITFWLTHVFINKIEKPVNNTYKSGHCRIYEFDNDIEQKTLLNQSHLVLPLNYSSWL